MHRLFLLTILCGLVSIAGSVHAQQSKVGIEAKDPWARASAGPSTTSAAYLSLVNQSPAPDRLISASSPVAGKAELHTMTMVGDVMRMRPVTAIDLAPGARIDLKPGGLHIMLLDLKAPLKEGDKFPLSLTFEKAGQSTVQVTVMSVAATGPIQPQNHMQHK